ncbi:hypothetical protein [Labrys sp. ZIDIC5]|uniref:hypothetical protein n=1 Tax=Labrys sedimenti TaxID=3106036 RepID=UPI002ACA3505|nr:hypothetical protein [Labrys sp. ZIDIC5]MDZ5450859.1 hypothetical protein [Labrys sp. ZIDIC5]
MHDEVGWTKVHAARKDGSTALSAEDLIKSYEGLLKSKREITESIKRIEEQITRYREQLEALKSSEDVLIRGLSKLEPLMRPHYERRSLANAPKIGPDTPGRAHLSPDAILAACREVLVDARRPMTRGELVRALEARGHVLGGKDKAKNVGTILWRHRDKFIQIPELGYWPADVELEGLHRVAQKDRES